MGALGDILNKMTEISQSNGLSIPFICGGTPRDKVMDRLKELSDIDITTGDDSIHKLAELTSKSVPNSELKIGNDHSQLMVGGLKIDFSSNFKVPHIELLLKGAGIKMPTPMQCELYSRDFTCNALLMDLNLKHIYDPTGLGLNDIKSKMIRTCLPAKMTLGSQTRRVVRVIYLAAKLNFEVDPEIINWVKANPSSILGAKPNQLTEKLNKAFEYNSEKTKTLISQMEISNYLPAGLRK